MAPAARAFLVFDADLAARVPCGVPAGAAFFFLALAVGLALDLLWVVAFFLVEADLLVVFLVCVVFVLEAWVLDVLVLCAKLEVPASAKLRQTKLERHTLRRGEKRPKRIPSDLVSIKTMQIIYLAGIVKLFIY